MCECNNIFFLLNLHMVSAAEKSEIPLVGCAPQSAEEKISGRLMCMKYKTNKKFLAAG
jgi:hypothetical protein